MMKSSSLQPWRLQPELTTYVSKFLITPITEMERSNSSVGQPVCKHVLHLYVRHFLDFRSGLRKFLTDNVDRAMNMLEVVRR